VLEQLVEPHQVGVMDIAHRAELVLEPQDGARRHLAQPLECEADPAVAVDDLVDHAHATAPELADELESVTTREGDSEVSARHEPLQYPAVEPIRKPNAREVITRVQLS
jgi:hypothetical protein